MNAAVFSDTHGNTARMVEAVRRTRPDVLIHLGDYERDTRVLRREFPETPLYSVCGNCDYGSRGLLADVVPLGPVRAYITHGHRYNVDWNVDSLVYAAQERECQLALYGHTHRADSQEIGGVKVVNPGTAGQGYRLSYAWITVFDNGGIAVEIRDL
jgi:putative phosphoesterase